jgi:hypothetical protein
MKGWGRKKEIRNLGIGKSGGYSNIRRKDIQDIRSRNKTTNWIWISGGGDRNCRAKHIYRTNGFYIDYIIAVGETNVCTDIKYFHFISII